MGQHGIHMEKCSVEGRRRGSLHVRIEFIVLQNNVSQHHTFSNLGQYSQEPEFPKKSWGSRYLGSLERLYVPDRSTLISLVSISVPRGQMLDMAYSV